MHINLTLNHDEYSQAELLHLQQCSECQEDYNSLKQINHAVQAMPLLIPDEFNWQAIQQRTVIKEQQVDKQGRQKARSFIYQKLMAIAASTFFIAVGWLVWNNHQLQSQLEQVLLVNSILEEKISLQYQPNYQQTLLVAELRDLDIELFETKSKKDQLTLLIKRHAIIEKHLTKQQGAKNVFSI